jgi:hypothetical protein
MGNPYLNRNESIILATHKVMVKSVSSDVLLTNERLIIADSGHEQFLPHNIPLAVIETVSLRENANGDPEISISIAPPTRDDAPITLSLAFVQVPGELRSQEIGDWTAKLREHIALAREVALKTGIKPVYPEVETPNVPASLQVPVATVRISPRQPSFRERVTTSSPKGAEPQVESPESLSGFPPAAEQRSMEAPDLTPGNAETRATPPVRGTPAPSGLTPKRSTIFVVAAVIVFIFVIAAGVFLVSGSLTGKTPVPVPTVAPLVTVGVTIVPTQPVTISATAAPSLKATPVTTAEPQLIIPQTGVWARITTTGNFTGSIGPAGRMQPVTGSGTRFYQIPARNEIVEVAIQKQDGSGNPLTVEIFNNGVPAGNATTSSPRGTIDLHVNLNTP